jgi:hypothetical protein
MQLKNSTKESISKFVFSSPIALFLGIGICVATDLIQPSYFKNLSIYYPYVIFAIFVGYIAVFLASSYIGSTQNKFRATLFAIIFMAVEGLFSVLAVQTYYGSQEIPILRLISAICLPLVFSMFYFLKIIEADKKEKGKINEEELFKNFDELERSKPNL